MGFTDEQTRALAAKLNGKHVRTRDKDGFTVSYIEGWHAIAEANRVFGYDAWDRHTLSTKCIMEQGSHREFSCSYVARVRIRVRAGDHSILRDGTGFGSAVATTAADAHERAIKEAETDAMKRALVTFGNPFGLALYDQGQSNVRPVKGRPVRWIVYGESGEVLESEEDPIQYCSQMRSALEGEYQPFMAFWRWNQDTVARLKRELPRLKSDSGQHYGDILSTLYTKRLQVFARQKQDQKQVEEKPALEPPHPVIKTVAEAVESTKPLVEQVAEQTDILPQTTLAGNNLRASQFVRDREHLAYVASHPCLVCGIFPSHAHHIKYAQPRALSRKVSDEYTVPLCAEHHSELHAFGNERAWWHEKVLDPLTNARALWERSQDIKKAS